MKNTIILCNTYFQLIVAIQMKLSIKQREKVTVILSDHSNNAEKVAENLENQNVFENVIFLKSKDMDQGKHSVKVALKNISEGVSGEWDIPVKIVFDEFLYYNLSVSASIIFASLYNKNPKIQCNRFEEGILSYDNTFHDGESGRLPLRLKAVNKLRRLKRYKNILECTKNFYCFSPELYCGLKNTIKLPLIETNGEIRKILQNIFGIYEEFLDYRQKYIFFGSTYDTEGGMPIGELELIKRIASIVGRENLLVKPHPRGCIEKYSDTGLSIDKNSFMPWEAIQLQKDFSDYVFLTVSSGSAFSINFIIEHPPQTILLYSLCDANGNKIARQSVKALKNVMNRKKLDYIYTPSTEKDFINIIKTLS